MSWRSTTLPVNRSHRAPRQEVLGIRSSAGISSYQSLLTLLANPADRCCPAQEPPCSETRRGSGWTGSGHVGRSRPGRARRRSAGRCSKGQSRHLGAIGRPSVVNLQRTIGLIAQCQATPGTRRSATVLPMEWRASSNWINWMDLVILCPVIHVIRSNSLDFPRVEVDLLQIGPIDSTVDASSTTRGTRPQPA